MTLLKNEQCAHELWNEGVVGKLHTRAKRKNSHFHSNSNWRQFKPLSLAINLVTWLADFFCELAKELNKKARANTKSKRDISTFRALRYEMADESVSMTGNNFPNLFILPHNRKIQDVLGLVLWKVFTMHNENL